MYDTKIHQTEEKSSLRWLVNVSEIAPGASAIIGGNRVAFYAIHHIALWIISASLISSAVVIISIYSKWKRFNSKLDFPIRFPLYLAIAEMLWGISHFIDHMYLLTVQKLPDNSAVILVLCINLFVFFGYQQLMHASVAGYTYFRVVHERKLLLGKWEWKLHLIWFSLLALSSVAFQWMGSFGNTGYWMGFDVNRKNGLFVGFSATLGCTFNAFTTTLCYRSIRRKVIRIEKGVSETVQSDQLGNGDSMEQRQSTASQCLTTYVYVASFLYCPLAVLLWVGILFHVCMGVFEPVNCFLVVILSNVSGCANAYGYFYNERLKKKRVVGAIPFKTPYIAPNISFTSSSSSYEV